MSYAMKIEQVSVSVNLYMSSVALSWVTHDDQDHCEHCGSTSSSASVQSSLTTTNISQITQQYERNIYNT
jgi:hypothetical protein